VRRWLLRAAFAALAIIQVGVIVHYERALDRQERARKATVNRLVRDVHFQIVSRCHAVIGSLSSALPPSAENPGDLEDTIWPLIEAKPLSMLANGFALSFEAAMGSCLQLTLGLDESHRLNMAFHDRVSDTIAATKGEVDTKPRIRRLLAAWDFYLDAYRQALDQPEVAFARKLRLQYE
jgi:hypothetical protein